jgi:hypothetical protein
MKFRPLKKESEPWMPPGCKRVQKACITFSGGKRMVIDGPFREAKELIAGYGSIQVKSREEAIERAKRAPNPQGPDKEGEIELRQVFEMEDFAPSEAIDGARNWARN